MPSGYLSRDEYLALASKQSPLEPAMRPAAYDAFEEYLKKKKKNGLYDVCDLAPLSQLCHRGSRANGLAIHETRVLLDRSSTSRRSRGATRRSIRSSSTRCRT